MIYLYIFYCLVQASAAVRYTVRRSRKTYGMAGSEGAIFGSFLCFAAVAPVVTLYFISKFLVKCVFAIATLSNDDTQEFK
jgi:hypothetical protein